jgi:hypothetical protein
MSSPSLATTATAPNVMGGPTSTPIVGLTACTTSRGHLMSCNAQIGQAIRQADLNRMQMCQLATGNRRCADAGGFGRARRPECPEYQ